MRNNKPPPLFERYRRRATELTSSPERLRQLVSDATAKATRVGNLSARFNELATLIDLLRAQAKGEYRQVSNSTLISIAAAVLYFILPLDLLPDFIVGLGLIDDFAIISYVFGLARGEIAAFERWRSAQDEDALPDPTQSRNDSEAS